MDRKRYRFNAQKQRVFTVCDGLQGFWSHCSRLLDRDPELRKFVVNSDNAWCGGSFDDLKGIIAAGGWSDPVKRARACAAKIFTAVKSRGVRPCWRSDVAGVLADVPAFVAGASESMRRRDLRSDDNTKAPLTLWIGLGATIEVTSKDVERRGGLVLAAYLALSRVRRVRVRVYSTEDRGNVIINLPERFSISELCALAVSPNLYRRMILHACCFSIQYMSNAPCGNKPGYVFPASWMGSGDSDVLRPYGFKDGDLLIGPGQIGAWDSISDDDMVSEINGFVRRAVSGSCG